MKSAVLFFSCLLSAFVTFPGEQKGKMTTYLPLGDSYTICTGAEEASSWPVLLTRHLNDRQVKVLMLDNPARNGFSTQDLIDHELPLVIKSKPGFVTMLIGVNDWVREVPEASFKRNLKFILDEIQKVIEKPKNIILITIPDFGVTPQGKKYARGRDISSGIRRFNDIIRSESRLRGLPLVDIFGASRQMEKDPELIAEDGLHPSAKEYAIWEKLILAETLKLLK